jgi:hypothetical protein
MRTSINEGEPRYNRSCSTSPKYRPEASLAESESPDRTHDALV